MNELYGEVGKKFVCKTLENDKGLQPICARDPKGKFVIFDDAYDSTFDTPPGEFVRVEVTKDFGNYYVAKILQKVGMGSDREPAIERPGQETGLTAVILEKVREGEVFDHRDLAESTGLNIVDVNRDMDALRDHPLLRMGLIIIRHRQDWLYIPKQLWEVKQHGEKAL